MSFDVNNNYRGSFYGKDRLGFTTPDADASEPLRPWIPVQFPAPWLPGKRRDDGHPVGAQVVISSHQLVGVDKSGALVPAGLIAGQTAASAYGDKSGFCLIKYGSDDVGFAYNAQTGTLVAAAGEYALIAAPENAAAGTVVDGVAITADDITFAQSCTLIPGGYARAIGYAIRNVFQYLGGVNVLSATGGMLYTQDGMIPTKFRVHNYMHEPGTAIQTHYVLRVPYIGASETALAAAASAMSVSGYVQSDFSRSFVCALGRLGSADGNLFRGCSVVPADAFGSKLSGNFMPFDSTKHKVDQIVGKVLGIESLIPVKDYADRVRTQFDRATEFVGPFREQNPIIMQMGGSATRGIDYQVNLSTNGLYRMAKDQGKNVAAYPEVASYVYIHVKC